MPPIIDKEKCSRCGTCYAICPLHIFSYEKGETPEVKYPEECWHCNACVLDCPSKSIELRIPLNYMLLHVEAANLRPQEGSQC